MIDRWNVHWPAAVQALEDQLQFTRALIDGAPVAPYVRDIQGRLAQCNQAYLNFFKASRESVIRKTLIESQVFDADNNVRFHEAYMDALRLKLAVFLNSCVLTRPVHAHTTLSSSKSWRASRCLRFGCCKGFPLDRLRLYLGPDAHEFRHFSWRDSSNPDENTRTFRQHHKEAIVLGKINYCLILTGNQLKYN